jgi:hypothetical protein
VILAVPRLVFSAILTLRGFVALDSSARHPQRQARLPATRMARARTTILPSRVTVDASLRNETADLQLSQLAELRWIRRGRMPARRCPSDKFPTGQALSLLRG